LIIGGDAKADAVDVAKRSSDQQNRVQGFFMLGRLGRLRIIIALRNGQVKDRRIRQAAKPSRQ